MNRRLFLVWFGSLAIAVLPLVHIATSLDPVFTPRWFYLQFLVCLMLPFTTNLMGNQRLPTNIIIPGSLFLFWSLLSISWVHDWRAGTLEGARLISSVSLLPIGLYLGQKRDDGLRILKAMALAGGFTALIGCLQTYGFQLPSIYQLHAPASTFVNRNLASEFVAATLILNLILVFWEDHKGFLSLWLVSTALSSHYLLFARSRASWIALIAGTLIVICLFRFSHDMGQRLKQLGNSRLAMRFILLGFLTYLLFPGYFHGASNMRASVLNEAASFSQSEGAVTGEAVNTVQIRTAYYANSLKMAAAKPFSGFGLGGFSAHYPQFHNAWLETPDIMNASPDYTHFDLLQIQVELGLMGLIFFLTLFGQISVRIFFQFKNRDVNILTLASLGMVLTLVCNSMFSFPLRQPSTAMLFFLGLGLLLSPMLKPSKTTQTKIIKLALVFLWILGIAALFIYGQAHLANKYRHKASDLFAKGFKEAALKNQTQAAALTLDWRSLDEILMLLENMKIPIEPYDPYLKELLQRRPFNANLRLRYAALLHKKGRSQEALRIVEAVLVNGYNQEQVLLLHALIKNESNLHQSKIEAGKQ